jgi:hypothetical protein
LSVSEANTLVCPDEEVMMSTKKIAQLTANLHKATSKTAAADVVAVVEEDGVKIYTRVWMVEGMPDHTFKDLLKRATTRVHDVASDLVTLLKTAGIEVGIPQGQMVSSSNKRGSLFVHRTIPAYLPDEKISKARDIVSKSSKVRLVRSMENAR